MKHYLFALGTSGFWCYGVNEQEAYRALVETMPRITYRQGPWRIVNKSGEE